MKYLHTMLRVLDLEKSLKFYCEALGFNLISREDH
jgi:lactoylglutathione lyase